MAMGTLSGQTGGSGEPAQGEMRAPPETLPDGGGRGSGYVVDSGGDEIDDEDDDESEVEDGEGGEGPSSADPEVGEWVSLENHPVHTSQRIQAALARLANVDRRNLTILLLGRTGAGKSSTANSLFGSRMFTVAPFNFPNYMPHQPNTISKRKVGVVVTIIDTIGLVESDSVNDKALRQISYAVQSSCSIRTRRPIDVVLYVDRIDMPRVEDLDHEVLEGITKTFGPEIWKHLLIGLTRSEVRNPAPFQSYDDYVQDRVLSIRAAMRRAGARNASAIPYALIENSSRCRKNSENEQILPNNSVWVPTLVERAVDLALRNPGGYIWNSRRRNLLQNLLLIPLLFIGQILFKFIVIDKLIEEDGVKGDQYGPYDLETQKEERRRMQERKELERQQREEAKRRARRARQRRQADLEAVSASDSDEEDEDYY